MTFYSYTFSKMLSLDTIVSALLPLFFLSLKLFSACERSKLLASVPVKGLLSGRRRTCGLFLGRLCYNNETNQDWTFSMTQEAQQ